MDNFSNLCPCSFNITKNDLKTGVYLLFLDPWAWPEGSYKLGSVRPFVFLSFHPEVFLGLAY